ncbi:MAG: 8-amino-7-oxononanoate synthase [Gammaproteobacteria bacterium]|nr:8-amino-7-oxononanoate synthase [Gammaproteobacteria bacterium]
MQKEACYQQFLTANVNPRELKYYEYDNEATSAYVYHNSRQLINFSSNDYLGLARHPELIARSHAYAKQYGVGATSSRLVTGNLQLYQSLEAKLAEALQKPAALILGSGYQTNVSVLEALLDRRVLGGEALVFADKYAHVSLLTVTQHLCQLKRFIHNDLDHLQLLLNKHRDSTSPKFIIVESVYSMDGDIANLVRLIELAKEHNAMLYVDDAHAVGIYGAKGWGKAPEFSNDIDIIMGTFSKGLGSFGGYIGCSEIMKQYLINKCRGLIYSTGPSPAVLGAMSAAIDILPMLGPERQRLMNHSKKIRDHFDRLGLHYGNADTHIVPWIIGDAEKTLRASQLLEARGILATSIRPPTVPLGKSRIRFCLSAMHSEADIRQLIRAVEEVKELL